MTKLYYILYYSTEWLVYYYYYYYYYDYYDYFYILLDWIGSQ